jgi:hypothetical protein
LFGEVSLGEPDCPQDLLVLKFELVTPPAPENDKSHERREPHGDG